AQTLITFVGAYDSRLSAAIQCLPSIVGTIGGGTNLVGGIRLANDLLSNAPRGLLRRAWLLSDGADNIEQDRLFAEAARSCELRVNLNPIGFDDLALLDEARLHAVANATRNGRYVPVATAQALGKVWRSKAGPAAHPGEGTVFVVDASPSMN